VVLSSGDVNTDTDAVPIHEEFEVIRAYSAGRPAGEGAGPYSGDGWMDFEAWDFTYVFRLPPQFCLSSASVPPQFRLNLAKGDRLSGDFLGMHQSDSRPAVVCVLCVCVWISV
jgi:hypothetical protein